MARTTRRPRGPAAVAATLVAAGLALGACSGGDEAAVAPTGELVQGGGEDLDVDPGAVEPGADGEAARETGDAVADDALVASGEDAPTAADAAGRDLVQRVTVALSSDDPDATVDGVEQAATDAGGFIAGTHLARDAGLLRGSLVIRVPGDALEGLLDAIEATAAEVTARDRTVEDVTGVVADLDSRLRNLRALEQELLVLLTEAREGGTTEDVLAVFDRVGQVREEIELLDGRRADLGDQVALSTVTVQVEPSPGLLASVRSQPDEDLPLPWSPGNVAATTLDATVATLQSFVDVVIRSVLFLLPVLLVWLSPLWVALLVAMWWRRHRARPGSGTPDVADDGVGPSGPRDDSGSAVTDPDRQPVGATTTD